MSKLAIQDTSRTTTCHDTHRLTTDVYARPLGNIPPWTMSVPDNIPWHRQ